MHEQPERTKTLIDLLAVLCLVAMTVLLVHGQLVMSPTVDEPLHIIRGVAWWTTDSTQLSFAHPPLANLIQGLPVVLTQNVMDLTTLAGWSTANHSDMAKEMGTHHYPMLLTWIRTGRLASGALALGLASYVYFWCRRRFDPVIALMALVFTALNPTVLAHGQVVTTDLPVSLAYMLAVGTFIDYLLPLTDKGRRWNLAWFALGISAAITTKFTGMVLVPFFAGIGIIAAAAGLGRFRDVALRRRLTLVILHLALVSATCLFALNAVYRFEGVGLTVGEILERPEPIVYITRSVGYNLLDQMPIANLPDWLPLPVPYTWLFGVFMVAAQGTSGHGSWFLGQITDKGHWAYFPLLLLIKTPPVVLAGLCLLPALAFFRRAGWLDMLLALAAATLLGLLMRSQLNIGVRHALPVVPLLSILSARCYCEMVRLTRVPDSRWSPPMIAVTAALMLTVPAAAVYNAGHHLSWFSVGPDLGYQVSIVGEDWGQDVSALAELVHEEDLQPLYFARYGASGLGELRIRGIHARQHRCKTNPDRLRGWLAVHRSQFVRYKDCFRLGERKPHYIVEHHIYVFKVGPQAKPKR
ncbi:MAG: hypothetical protein ACI9MC_000543 [Kiritimatiellia bacterium]|jgi:hypothetical protein